MKKHKASDNKVSGHAGNKVKISACLITKNEEENINRCIESFRESVDEIILVDTGSIDQTVQLAEKSGAKVYFYQWDNSFSNARNYALDKASGDWVIFLDADEYFAHNTGKNIPGILNNAEPGVEGYLCKWSDISKDGKHESSITYMPRIFKNSKSIRYYGNIHEAICKNGQPLSFQKIPDNSVRIYHTGYDSESKLQQKNKNYLNCLLNEIKNGNRDPKLYAYMAFAYLGQKEYLKAIQSANKFIESGNHLFGQNVKLYLTLIFSMMELNFESELIISKYKEALVKYPDHPDLYYHLGRYLFSRKKCTEAIKVLEKGIKFGKSYNDVEIANWLSYEYDLYYMLGALYELVNDYTKAEEYLTKALVGKKYNSDVLKKLIFIMKLRNSERILPKLKNLYSSNNMQDVQFLLGILAQLRIQPSLKHYYQAWKKLTGQDDITYLFVLLSDKQYSNAFEYFFSSYQTEKNDWFGIFSAVSALMENNRENIEKIRLSAGIALKKILDCYLTKDDNVIWGNSELNCYLAMFNEFLFLNGVKQIDRMLNFKDRFQEDISQLIGTMCFEAGQFERAAVQFKDALAASENKADLYFKIALCYYKMFNYGPAAEYLEKALGSGYKDQEAVEILNWIRQNSTKPKKRQINL